MLDAERRNGESNEPLFAAVAAEAEEYVPGSSRAVEGKVLFGVAGIDNCMPAYHAE